MESSAQNIMAIRKATGLSPLDAKKFIEEKDALLCERIVSAKMRDEGLYDPIEDDENLSSVILSADKEAEIIANTIHESEREDLEKKGLGFIASGRGKGHLICYHKKRILKEKHSIIWYSRMDMNPCIIYD